MIRTKIEHKRSETLFLIQGKAEITIGDETKTFDGLIELWIEPMEFHKVVALTDINIIGGKISG